ncbi:MAG: division/cell wall cluster transcriptional repressor MraZ [Dehalococcoidia bacterium]|nr:MAG: division/cell wall cluster transcriptional repressor MraZ [Dehalococcoidia bacterium]
MFFGEYEYKIDEKGRVPLPPRFRAHLKDGVVLIPGIEKCITAYPVAEWKKLAASFTGGTVTRRKLRQLNRALFATASYLNLDGQGRISLPPLLREYAEIVDEVVTVGTNNYFELWNSIHWEEEKAANQDQVWQIIESLEGNEGA